MTKFKIHVYPDPVLLKKSHDVTDFGEEMQHFFDDMIEMMYTSDGVGLAAPQVGISQKIFIVSPRAKRGEERVFVNPEIYESEGRVLGAEGCLSFPGLAAEVYRAKKIRIRYQDRSGNRLDEEFKDFFARVIQHENDHLNGVVFIDRVDFNQRQKLLAEYNLSAKP